jgi:hypothetical protein
LRFDFEGCPAAFVELAHKTIALARRDILTQGITYECTGEHFEALGVDLVKAVNAEDIALPLL